MPPRGKLTKFLVKLSKNKNVRDEYADKSKRNGLLAREGLAGNSAFAETATVEDMRAAVVAEDPNDVKYIEAWILVDSAPQPNSDYDPNAT